MAKIRTCMVDGTKYTYCPHCSADDPTETWRFLYCSEKCKNVYHVVDDFAHDKLSAKDAKFQLENIGIIDNLTKFVKEDYDKIMASSIDRKKSNKKNLKKVEESTTIVNDFNTEEIKIEDTNDLLFDSTLL